MHLGQGLGNLIVKVLCKIHQEMIGYRENSSSNNGEAEVGYESNLVLILIKVNYMCVCGRARACVCGYMYI